MKVLITPLLFFVITLSIKISEVSGFNCYDDTCISNRDIRGCKTRDSEFGNNNKKFNCEYGCAYKTIKDLSGRAVGGQPFKVRQCWEKYREDERLKNGNCVEDRRYDNRVDRTCVCKSDWCNGPDQDEKFDKMSSSPAVFGYSGVFCLSMAVFVIAIRFL